MDPGQLKQNMEFFKILSGEKFRARELLEWEGSPCLLTNSDDDSQRPKSKHLNCRIGIFSVLVTLFHGGNYFGFSGETSEFTFIENFYVSVYFSGNRHKTHVYGRRLKRALFSLVTSKRKSTNVSKCFYQSSMFIIVKPIYFWKFRFECCSYYWNEDYEICQWSTDIIPNEGG